MSFYSKWFPKIDGIEDAKAHTKKGAIGVLIFAAMNMLGLIFVLYFNQSPVNTGTLDAQGVQDQIIGSVIIIPLLLFFAYRVYIGKGWIAGGLVLVWFVVEIALKTMGGTANIGWMIFYVFVLGMLVNGIRGCWWLRKDYQHAEAKAEPDA